MRIYFDMCSLQRPLDDKAQVRILVEAEAVLGMLSLCESGAAELLASDALVFEADANTDLVRKDFAAQTLAKASQFVHTNEKIKERAQQLVSDGVKALDALHLASAIEAAADYFCTCDDRLLKKAKAIDTSPTKVVSPLELVSELEP